MLDGREPQAPNHAVQHAATSLYSRRPQATSPAVTAQDLATHIRTLSADEFEGRGPASAGEDKTIRYLSEQMEAAGLSPGNGESWYQAAIRFMRGPTAAWSLPPERLREHDRWQRHHAPATRPRHTPPPPKPPPPSREPDPQDRRRR